MSNRAMAKIFDCSKDTIRNALKNIKISISLGIWIFFRDEDIKC
jgi:transcriptional antiterminator